MSKILVGADASDRSSDAAAFARELARASGAEVLVASVFPYESRPGRAANAEYRHALEADARRTAARVADELSDLGDDRVRTTTVAQLSPAHGLQYVADEDHVALVVVGSSHVGRAGRVLPGSTAERLLHGAPCPVAVVPKGYSEGEPGLHVVGVAYDGSAESEAALRAAVAIAHAAGAALRVISVVDASVYTAPAILGAPAAVHVDGVDDIREAMRKQLEEAVAALPAAVRAAPVLLTGNAEREIAEQSETLDLIVTGSRGYGPLRAVLLGAFSGRLLRDAACPVLVVPRGVEAPLDDLFAQARATA